LHDFDAALQTYLELQDVREVAAVLEGLAELAVCSENFLRAARLSGVADALRTRFGVARPPSMEVHGSAM
jgi:hypothetical protein